MTFFGLSVAAYGALVWWLAATLDASAKEWGFALGHLVLAAAVNAYLLHVARARSLSLIASAPVVALLVSQLYFTVNGLKYFSPILLHPQFDLSLTAQFVGSAAGAAVLFASAACLHFHRGPDAGAMLGWADRYWGDLRRLMVVSVAGSLLFKFALYRLGYGSTYTEAEFSDRAVRTYGDFFILLGNETFGLLSLMLGMLVLLRPRQGPARPVTGSIALLGVLGQVAYTLVYLKARMILLVTAIIIAASAEVRSRRLAERLLQLMLLALPAASLLGVQLTMLLGRVNLPEDTGMRLAIAAVNRRADLTDFATAIVLNSGGRAYDPAIVPAALLNAIPRVVFPGKQEVVRDVYSDVLERHLGWPAYVDREMVADYQDSMFSAGVMALGVAGFFLVPPALFWALYLASRLLERTTRGAVCGVGLIALWLTALRVEVEWATIPLNFRQAVSTAIIAYLVLRLAREGHRILAVASRPGPPAIPPDPTLV